MGDTLWEEISLIGVGRAGARSRLIASLGDLRTAHVAAAFMKHEAVAHGDEQRAKFIEDLGADPAKEVVRPRSRGGDAL